MTTSKQSQDGTEFHPDYLKRKQRKIFAKKKHKKKSAENDAIELRNWLHSLSFMKLMKLGEAEGEERDVHETDKNAYKILV